MDARGRGNVVGALGCLFGLIKDAGYGVEERRGRPARFENEAAMKDKSPAGTAARLYEATNGRQKGK